MTTTERNHLVLVLLEHVTPLLRQYAAKYAVLSFDDLYQDASIHIICLIDAGTPQQDLERYSFNRVRSRIIDKIRYTTRRQAASLDAPINEQEGAATLADFLPSPYKAEPLAVLLAQERLQELFPILDQRMNPRRRRAIRERWETAAASAYSFDEDMASVSEMVHTVKQPYCKDVRCFCHTDIAYHTQVTAYSASHEVEPASYDNALAFLTVNNQAQAVLL
jgi:RNA polymerase sigma factor (sigma-70 family)